MTRIFGLTALLLLLSAAGLSAQQSRADLIDAALESADDDIRVGLLIRALDPQLGAPDSLWAVGAFSIAYRLSETGRENQARTWLRWAAREGAGLGLSPRDFPALFPPSLARAWDQVAEVDTDTGDVRVTTDYEWPSAFIPGSPGVLIIEAEGAEPGTVAEIEGVGTIPLGVRRALEPGTYELVVTGPDGTATRVRREVLAGIDRTVSFQFGDQLGADARARAEASLLRLRRGSGANAVCSNGVVVGEPGWFVAPLGFLDDGGIEAVTPDGTVLTDIDVMLRDADLGIGVGRLADSGAAVATTAEGGDAPTWALFHDGCGPVRVVSAALGEGGGARVPVSSPPASAGGPVVDAEGAMVALGLGATALRASDVEQAVERARRAVMAAAGRDEGDQPPQEGGGFPLKWVAGGVAAAGIAAALLLGGGGGDDPTGVVVSWPGG